MAAPAGPEVFAKENALATLAFNHEEIVARALKPLYEARRSRVSPSRRTTSSTRATSRSGTRSSESSARSISPRPTRCTEIRALKVDLTFAIGGIKNHEIYFEHLGGDGDPDGAIGDLIERDFGSAGNWKADLTATGMAGRGWAWTAYDWDEGRLFNYLGDAQNTYPIWNATPLIALDVYEHAYFLDYQTDRASYIEAFFANLDWTTRQRLGERLRDSPSVNRFAESLTTFGDRIEPGAANAARGPAARRRFLT